MINELSHSWKRSPYYADIDYAAGTDRPYWWCEYCEEHRFQEEEPAPEPCQKKITIFTIRNVWTIAAICSEGIHQLGGIHD